MHITMTAKSAPCYRSEEELARLAESLPGYEVSWEKKRYRVSRRIASTEQIEMLWGAEIFRAFPRKIDFPIEAQCHPEFLSVRFENVGCASVCGISSTFGFAESFVVMTDNDDPVHAPLLSFFAVIDIPNRTIEIRADRLMLAGEKKFPAFVRLLRICEKVFEKPEKNVCFHRRKNVGRAKRRYLAWLAREKVVAQGLPAPERTNRGETIGKLEGADATWQRVVEFEKRLQQAV